jgi:hypothetical protein
MQCQDIGTTPLTLVQRIGDAQNGSHFLDDLGDPFDPALIGATVNCQPGATATPTVTATPTITPTATLTPTPVPLLGSMTVDCDATSPSTIDRNCVYGPGVAFPVAVIVTDPYIGYAGYQVKLRWTDATLDYTPTANIDDENHWPVTCLAARFDNQPGDPSMLYGCASFPITTSSYFGQVVVVWMQCETPGTTGLDLVPRPGDAQNGTHLIDGAGNPFDPALIGAQVTCGEAGTGTPALTTTATATRTLAATPTITATPVNTSTPTITASPLATSTPTLTPTPTDPPATSTPTPNPLTSCPDLNGDHTVDLFDLAYVSLKWGTADPLADINGDGTVDLFDLAIVSLHWDATCP